MTHPPLSLQRFLELVEAYGSHLSRWPAAEREAAEALLLVSEPARIALEAEVGLDDALASFAAPPLSPSLERRLNEIPIRVPAAPRARWPFRGVWAPLVGWAAAAALGVTLGTLADDGDDQPLANQVSTVQESSATDLPSDDALEALALGSFTDFEETP